MKAKVTEQGVVTPKKFLEGVAEVEITEENGLILVRPSTEIDPILGLGKHPVVCGLQANIDIRLCDR